MATTASKRVSAQHWRRNRRCDQLFLISKCGIKLISEQRPTHRLNHYDSSARHVVTSVDNSLRQLHTDRLDLLLIHRPDSLMDADEVAAVFRHLRQSGKVLHFGVSNFSVTQFELLSSRLDVPLLSNQVEVSVLHTHALYDGTLDQCQQRRIPAMAWSPLAGGRLLNGLGQQEQRVRRALQTVGSEYGWTVDQAALVWILTHPAQVVPILGTRHLDNIKATLAVAQQKMTREQWYTVLEASHGHSVP